MNDMNRRLKDIAILTLVGMPSYVLCFGWHICMAGHMHHGPYPWYQWASDFLWMTCYAAVLVFSLRLRAKGRMWFLCGSLLLIFFRVPLGSGGGGTVIFELPLLVIMGVYAGRYLKNPRKWTQIGERHAGPVSSEAAPIASPDEPSS